MMRQAPLGHDGAAARDDARHPPGGERHVAQQHAGVNGEVVHALLGLLDERVAVHLPGQLLGLAVHLLERLVDRHGAERRRRIAQDPLARLVDVLARREVHDRVGAPAGRPRHLLDFLLDRGAHRGVADIRVDLHQEAPADDHRLALRVVDVRGDDGAPARDLVADELGGHALAQRHELHLRGDVAAPRIVHLGHAPSRLAAQAPAAARARLHVVALEDPVAPKGRQALLQVDRVVRVGIGAAGVVQAHALAVGEGEVPHGHSDGGFEPERYVFMEASLRWHYPGQVRSGRQRHRCPLSPFDRAPA